MTNTENMNGGATVKIPARLAFVDGKPGERAIKGSAGTHGDAGWTLFEVPASEVQGFVHRHAAAAMPCWRRFSFGPTGELEVMP
jgi:hypothetical protein